MAESVRCPKCSAKVPAGSRFCQTCGTDVTAKPKAARKSGASSQFTTFVAGALIIILLGSLAIFGLQRLKARQAHEAAQAPAEATPVATNTIDGAGPMPDWLAKANKAIIADYTWAASHHDALQYFPCFCGCYQSAGHVSNSECYYKRDKAGTITAYDGHAYGWQICLDITRDVRTGMDKGKTLTQIRDEVDKRYQSQGLKPTPAPKPPTGK